MNVRNRPVLGQKADTTIAATDKGSVAFNRLVCDGMSDALIGIVNPSPEKANENRSVADMKLHLVIKTLMEKNEESARSAAKACKIPLSTFAGYLKPNKKQVDPGHLLAIAKHYGVSIDYLFGNQQSMKLDKFPTKRIFSKWVKVTIEDLEDSAFIEKKTGKGAEE